MAAEATRTTTAEGSNDVNTVPGIHVVA